MKSQKRSPRRGNRLKKSSAAKISQSSPRPRISRASHPRLTQRPPLIVGIGASAGGLQAFKTFFANMPPDSGMAFVLVQHLDPDHKSMLVDLLGAQTAMPVVEAKNRMAVAANRVFVIPPNATMTIARSILHVSTPAPKLGQRWPVDTFLSALAEDQADNAVGIILSGSGSDGTEGLRAVKEHGGLTLAQAVDEHALSGMPESATATGLVDYLLPVEKMPAKLIEYWTHLADIKTEKGPDGVRHDASEHLAKICTLLRGALGHDFSHYKEKTVVRRVQRRMQVLQIKEMAAYVERLRKEPREFELLFHELLIGVTQFFRDPPAFEVLQTEVVPKLLEDKGANDVVRVWVPACATGEEAYSIAILLKEAMGKREVVPKVQIFATDIDDHAIVIARAARYRKSRLGGISDKRRERWFVQDGDHWCLVKEIREMCIFSTHSLVKDPPFAKLDLISCRNLLIYLDSTLQDRLIRTFHYALRSGGYLFLGTAESVTRYGKLFATVNSKHRIFQRRDIAAGMLPTFPLDVTANIVAQKAAPRAPLDDVDKRSRRIMEKHFPPYIVVDDNYKIVRFSGQTEKYLGPSPGAASLNLFNLLQEPLRPAVRSALLKAHGTQRAVTHEHLAMGANSDRQLVDLVVEPIPGDNGGLYVIAFLDRGRSPGIVPTAFQPPPVEAIEKELVATRERLQATIDQFDTANEELKSSNEEYLSVNEELQSTNEELETSKEEMQSINEELQTVNAEMNSKNEALLRANSDIKNLLDSTQVATLFLDRQLRINRFTPAMTGLFHLRDSDRGRPVTEIVSRVDYSELRHDAARVLRDLSVVEREVHTADDASTFLMHIRPYRRLDDVIDGVVLTFFDITDRKRREQDRATLAAIVDSTQDAVIGHTLNGTITSWNKAAERIFGYTTVQAVGKPLAMLIPPGKSDEVPKIIKGLRRGKQFSNFDIERIRKDRTQVAVSLTISPVRDNDGNIIAASTIGHDITEQRQQRIAAALDLTPALIRDELGRIEYWSQGMQALFGYSAEQARGRIFHELLATVFPRPLSEIEAEFERTSEWGGKLIHRHRDGRAMIVASKWLRYREPDGTARIIHINTDITERERAEEKFRAAVEAFPGGMIMTDATGKIVLVNAGTERLFGYSRNELLGQSIDMLVPAAARRHHEGYRNGFVKRPEARMMGVGRDLRGVRKDGTEFPIEIGLNPIHSHEGLLVLSAIVDITERKHAEEQRQRLLQELNHRVKNTLSTVQSIAVQTSKSAETTKEFQQSFGLRLVALAKTHDLLTQSDWKGASLREVARQQLRPYERTRRKSFALPDTDVFLKPNAALALGMIFHELATNAAKYGALSVPTGQIQLSWEIDGKGEHRRLQLHWVESGGPPVEKPRRRGLGSTLIERGLPHELNCETRLDFEPTGLRCTIVTPLASVEGVP